MEADEEPRLGCIIRSYASTEGLAPCVLSPELVHDMPKWPDCGGSGSYYFYYNASENDWRVYADCY